MTIDLKWTLPFVMPFVFLGVLRLLFWVAGTGWGGNEEAAATVSWLLGAAAGTVTSVAMNECGIKWNITIGKARRGK